MVHWRDGEKVCRTSERLHGSLSTWIRWKYRQLRAVQFGYASTQALRSIMSYSLAKVLERNSCDVHNLFCQREIFELGIGSTGGSTTTSE